MKFQTKILLAYMTIVIIVILIIASVFYPYNNYQFKSSARKNILNTAERISLQIDYQITFMDSTLENLMSDAAFMDAIAIKGGPEPDTERRREMYVSSDGVITSTLYRYPLNKYIYRVNYFNRNLDFFTSRFNNRDTVNKGSVEIFDKMGWLEAVDGIQPKRYITPMHNDQWLKSGENMVFSIIRSIKIFNIDAGYLEVQMEEAKLREMLNIAPEEQLNIILATPEGELLFHNLDNDPEPYLSYADGIWERSHTVSGNRVEEFVASIACPYSNIRVILIEDQAVMFASQMKVGMIALLIIVAVLFSSFFYVYTWSVRLTRPIRTLRKEMKRIDLADLTGNGLQAAPDGDAAGTDDIKALNDAFYSLFNRLSQSVQNELKARELQTQANFDFLQAQINPHFIYNVLNVISNRGLMAGDEQICEICGSIAQMLRYSTSAQSKTATVAEEIAHVNNYLALLKTRYEHRLQYTIDIDPGIMPLEVPKIVLQPFVENSVTHGYKKGARDMLITITGRLLENGWFIEVRDNGDGFDDRVLERIQDTLRQVEDKISNGAGDLKLSFGGMGITATFARIKMFYPNISLSIENYPETGSAIRIETAVNPGRSNPA
ncbi:MAG: histidine kinase [Clostridiales bacterium]|jgi:two-component system sensor histidine kinase YesM|nr:histidine kinase [Clostridiales bacterium]